MRKLTVREWILLGLLAVIALVSGYIMLFHMPMTARRETALAEAELCRTQLDAAQTRLEEKRAMERELEALFAGDAEPLRLPDYDNLRPVMLELHTILSAAEDYSLSFSTVDDAETIVRRSISLSFTAGSYDGTKDILRRLSEGPYRCLLESVNLSVGGDGGSVSVSGAVLFFEYQKEPVKEPEPEA